MYTGGGQEDVHNVMYGSFIQVILVTPLQSSLPLQAALRARDAGSTRFCMGAAWRGPSQVRMEASWTDMLMRVCMYGAISQNIAHFSCAGIQDSLTTGRGRPWFAAHACLAGSSSSAAGSTSCAASSGRWRCPSTELSVSLVFGCLACLHTCMCTAYVSAQIRLHLHVCMFT